MRSCLFLKKLLPLRLPPLSALWIPGLLAFGSSQLIRAEWFNRYWMRDTFPFYEWQKNWYFPEKKPVLVAAALAALFLGIYWALMAFFHRVKTPVPEQLTPTQSTLCSRLSYAVVVAVGVGLLLTDFRPLWDGTVPIVNEFWDLPTRIPLSNGPKPATFDLQSTLLERGYLVGSKAVYSPLSPAHLARARSELDQQVMSRGWFHHHSFMLGSYSDWSLGKPLRQINFQYGFGATWLIGKWSEVGGPINLERYLRTSFFIYVFYFVLMAWVMYQVAGPTIGGVAILAFPILAYYSHGFEALLVAPGLNPVRHLFDFLTMYAWFRFMSAGMRELKWVCIAWLISIVGLLINRETGLFLVAALTVSHLHVSRNSARSLRLLMGMIPLLILAIAAYWIQSGFPNYLSHYYLGGLLGFPTRTIPFWFLGLAVGFWWMDAKFFEKGEFSTKLSARYHLAIFWMIYCVGLSTYALWGGTHHHRLKYLPQYAVCILLIFQYLICRTRPSRTAVRIWSAAGLVILAVTVVSARGHFLRDRDRLLTDRLEPVAHRWPFPHAEVLSFADPSDLVAAVELIQTNSSRSGIMMISRFDSILPYLARRYSEMPFSDLGWFLVSPVETNLVTERLLNTMPTNLFVDTEIDKDFSQSTFRSGLAGVEVHWEKEARLRADRLRGLRQVFDQVRDLYVLKERTRLLSLYVLKST